MSLPQQHIITSQNFWVLSSKTAVLTSNLAESVNAKKGHIYCGIITFFFVQLVLAYNATSGRLTGKLDR